MQESFGYQEICGVAPQLRIVVTLLPWLKAFQEFGQPQSWYMPTTCAAWPRAWLSLWSTGLVGA